MLKHNDIEHILPPVVKYKPYLTANLYGAFNVIENKYGVRLNKIAAVSWRHGWRIESCLYSDVSSIVEVGERHYETHLVTSEEEAQLVNSNPKYIGDAIAVGLPYAYVLRSENRIKRRKGSLLIMPPHGINEEYSFNNSYFENIQKLSKEFSYVCVCINDVDFKKGEMNKLCEKFGLDYVRGAVSNDKNALYRMRNLFEYFEYVTTPVLGSHIVYAAATGAKVSVYLAQNDCYVIEDYRRHPWYWNAMWYSNQLKKLDLLNHELFKNKWPWLYVEPIQAIENTRWALDEIGHGQIGNYEQLLSYTRLTGRSIISGFRALVRKIAQKFILFVINKKLRILGF
jgi:hypothetical protein